MRTSIRFLAVAALGAALVGSSSVPAHGEDESQPTPAEALAQAKQHVDTALTTDRGTKEAKDAVTAALELLEPLAPRSDAKAICEVWNDAVRLAAFHGVRTKLETVTDTKGLGAYVPLLYDLPVSSRWSSSGWKNDQLATEIVETRPGDRPLRTIRIWVYDWNTLYTGVKDIGGENVKGLAENDLQGDRWSSLDIKRRSRRVVKKRFNAHFTTAYFYEIEHYSAVLTAEVRSRNWYFKGSNRTYNVECIEYVGVTLPPEETKRLAAEALKDESRREEVLHALAVWQHDKALSEWDLEDGAPDFRALIESIRDPLE